VKTHRQPSPRLQPLIKTHVEGRYVSITVNGSTVAVTPERAREIASQLLLAYRSLKSEWTVDRVP